MIEPWFCCTTRGWSSGAKRLPRQPNTAARRAWGDQYMRMAMRFDTGAQKYVWLNQSLFIAEGRLAGPKEIEYRIYRVL
jgi:Protein of unknown function (DUF3237)